MFADRKHRLLIPAITPQPFLANQRPKTHSEYTESVFKCISAFTYTKLRRDTKPSGENEPVVAYSPNMFTALWNAAGKVDSSCLPKSPLWRRANLWKMWPAGSFPILFTGAAGDATTSTPPAGTRPLS